MRCVFALGIAVLVTLGLSAPAFAQGGTRPECRSFRNSHTCTCALNHGGRISDDPYRPGRKRWHSASRGTPAHMAFMNCSNGSGR